MKAQPLLLLLFLGLLSLALLPSPGTIDVKAKILWLRNVETLGVVAGYEASRDDYPPLNPVLLFVVAEASRLFQIDELAAFKGSLLVFLTLTSGVFLWWTRDLQATALLHLALLPNAMALGYTDVYFALPLLLSLWALRVGRVLEFTVLFSIACLFKWQPLIVAPFLGLYALEISGRRGPKGIDWRGPLRLMLLPAASILGLTLAVFGIEVVRTFTRATGELFVSGDALNFPWTIGYLLRQIRPDLLGNGAGLAAPIVILDLRVAALLKLPFVAAYAIACREYLRSARTFQDAILYSLLGFLAYFTFGTSVHENHLFLACLLAAVAARLDRRHLPTFATWAIVANANLFLFYGLDGSGLPFSRVVGVDLALPLSVVEVALFAAYLAQMVRERGILNMPPDSSGGAGFPTADSSGGAGFPTADSSGGAGFPTAG